MRLGWFERIDALLARRVPPGARELVRRALYSPVDLVERRRSESGIPLPPRGLRGVGAGDFVAIGREFADALVTLGDLKPGDRVLDIGCGIGRVALHLPQRLGTTGSYDGFDVSKPSIRWLRRSVTSRHPRFRFQRVDVRSTEYNPGGAIRPEAFRFPYEDGSFDLAFAVSLHTHLLPSASRRFLEESSRVLSPGGRWLGTFFLIDDANRETVTREAGPYRFPARSGEAYVGNRAVPEAAVAVEESALRSWLKAAALEPSRPILHGRWSGRRENPNFQDIVVCSKPR